MNKWINVKDGLPKHEERVMAVVKGRIVVTHIVFGLSFEDREIMKNSDLPSEMCGGYSGDPMTYSKTPRWNTYMYGDQDKCGNPNKAYKWKTGSDATHWMPLPELPIFTT